MGLAEGLGQHDRRAHWSSEDVQPDLQGDELVIADDGHLEERSMKRAVSLLGGHVDFMWQQARHAPGLVLGEARPERHSCKEHTLREDSPPSAWPGTSCSLAPRCCRPSSQRCWTAALGHRPLVPGSGSRRAELPRPSHLVHGVDGRGRQALRSVPSGSLEESHHHHPLATLWGGTRVSP